MFFTYFQTHSKDHPFNLKEVVIKKRNYFSFLGDIQKQQKLLLYHCKGDKAD